MMMSSVRFRSRLTSALVLAATASFGIGCHQGDRTIDPRFEDGAIFVSVVDHDGHDRGGVGRVTYVSRKQGKARSETAAFTGEQPVPVHVVVEKDDLDLSAIELVADATKPQAQALLSVGSAELSTWIAVARKGVRLSVMLDPSANGVSHAFSMRATPPVIASPDTSVSKPLPVDTLTGDVPAGAIESLRFAATATDGYHKALLDLVANTASLDAANLEAALRSVYFTGESIRELGEFIDHGAPSALVARSREGDEALRARARATLSLAIQLAPTTNAMLDANLERVTDLSFESGMKLLNFLVAFGDSEAGTAAFQALVSRVKLTGEQKLAVAALARDKRSFTAVRTILLDWFQTDAGYSIKALGDELATLVPAGGFRDAIVLQAASEFTKLSGADLFALGSLLSAGDAYSALLDKGAPLVATLSTAELIELMGQSNSWATQVMTLFFSKLSDSSVLNLAAIGAHLSGDARQAFALNILGSHQTLTADEFAAVVELLEGDLRDTTILAWLPRITERDAVHLARLFGLLSPSARASHLLSFLDALPNLTTDALIALAQAAPERTSFILTAYVDRLTDFTPANAVKIARFLSSGDKDSILLLAMERAKTVTAGDLYEVGAAAYEKATYLLTNNLSKVSPLDAQGVANLSRLINDYTRDEFVQTALDKMASVTTDDLILMANATYNRGQALLVHGLGFVSDLTVDNTVKIANRVSASDQDTVIKFWFSKNSKLTTQQLIQLAQADYYSGSPTIIAQVDKVSDLTVDNAIALAQRLNYGDRDTFLLKAVTLVTDLSSANLMTLAGNSYSARDQIIQKGIDRLANHSQ